MNNRYVIPVALALILTLGLVNVVQTAASGTVEQRLQRLEDIEEIRALLIHYGRELDKRDFAAYGRLFASDGTWKGGMGSATSPSNIANMVEEGFGRMSPKQYENSNHVMTSLDIQVDGDTATAWSRWLWVVVGDDGRPRTERGGHYEDSLVRENGHWRFQTRQAVTEITQ